MWQPVIVNENKSSNLGIQKNLKINSESRLVRWNFRLISILALISSPWNLILILFGVAVAFQRFPLKDKLISIGIMGTYVMTLLSYFIFRSMYNSATERFSAGDFESAKKHCIKIKYFFIISVFSIMILGILMYLVWIHK